MKKLLNILYITDPDCYLGKEGTNIVISKYGKIIKRFPIHILESVICFNYVGVSPALMKLCGENNIQISFLTPSGSFCGIITGQENGNVLLRREQYRISDDDRALEIAKKIIFAKVINSRKVINRALRDHKDRVNERYLSEVSDILKENAEKIQHINYADILRGIEGDSAKYYFSTFDDLILSDDKDFSFVNRSKRPPLNIVNAMLSFFYSILTSDCQSALQSVGLDSYVGFFHTDRPGRASLALDLMEEFRAFLVDRFVISCINLKRVSKNDFEFKENGAVLMNENGRNKLLDLWQKRKHEEIKHPFLGEKVEIGLLPYIQAMLLAKYIRNEIESYPPFIISW